MPDVSDLPLGHDREDFSPDVEFSAPAAENPTRKEKSSRSCWPPFSGISRYLTTSRALSGGYLASHGDRDRLTSRHCAGCVLSFRVVQIFHVIQVSPATHADADCLNRS